jgi:GntR family transcriptional regulator
MAHHSSLRGDRLDRGADTPLWQQLVAVLREAVREGELAPDQALPSEAELIDRFGVSRTVVREALAELVREGLIYKIRAKGSFVSPAKPALRFIGSTLGSAADLSATGRTVATRVLSIAEGVADEDEAAALRLDEGAEVIRLRRLRSVDGVPWLLVDTALPKALFPSVARANLENRSLYEHLRRHYGVTPKGADRWLEAVIPTAEQAELLQLAPGEPALAIESISWSEDGTPFEFYRGLHRSGEPRFHVGIR